MGSKPLFYPAPTYRSLETYWDTDDDAPGPRCAHTLTAIAATKTHGPRLILFGGATAIEGGASSSAPGIRTLPLPPLSFSLSLPSLLSILNSFLNYVLGLAGVTNCIHSYDVLTRKWTRHVFLYSDH